MNNRYKNRHNAVVNPPFKGVHRKTEAQAARRHTFNVSINQCLSNEAKMIADFIGNPSINFINATGKQSPDGEIVLSIFNDYKLIFKPNEDIQICEWYQRRNKILF